MSTTSSNESNNTRTFCALSINDEIDKPIIKESGLFLAYIVVKYAFKETILIPGYKCSITVDFSRFLAPTNGTFYC